MHSAVLKSVDSPAWVDAACESLTTVASTALRLPTVLLGPIAAPTGTSIGAYVPVMTPSESLQIAIVADEASCQQLARALLQMSADDEISAADVADAFGEIANMVAGMTKAAISSHIGLVGLGLPMVIHGWVAPSDGLEIDCVAAMVGTTAITVLVVRPRQRR